MIICGDALTELRKLPDESTHCCVTSPPYWGLRDYGIDGQLGLEKTPEEYVAKLVEVFREVRRVLRKDGTLWLNLGDSYCANATGSCNDGVSTLGGGKKTQHKAAERPDKNAPGLKPKDLVGIPWRVAFALQADGWYLRSDIIWAKPNPMPESVRDRPTRSHEYIFLMSKSAKYYFDQEAVKEPTIDIRSIGRRTATNRQGSGELGNSVRFGGGETGHNIRSVWTMTTKPFKEAHFATFPPELPERCIKAGCPMGGVVLDPFFGAGTVGMVAKQLGRDLIGIELNQKYCEMAEKRISATVYQMEMPAMLSKGCPIFLEAKNEKTNAH